LINFKIQIQILKMQSKLENLDEMLFSNKHKRIPKKEFPRPHLEQLKGKGRK
jgi:hypothetical protein